MKVSVVAPMFNEEKNLQNTYSQVTNELVENEFLDFELIFVNDGSTDKTWELAKKMEESHDNLHVVGYPINQGRGKALRTGIAHASGDVICTIDFDLSYDTSHITRMINTLIQNPLEDVVLSSCYMPGGQTVGIPPFRLFISKAANLLYRYAFTPKIYTSTCVVRAYRKEAIKSLVLESNDKEIHLEIISKLLANNYKILEIPGTLKRRMAGKSSFKFKSHSISHILFFIQERPFALFGILGVMLFIAGMFSSTVLLINRLNLLEGMNDSLLYKFSSPTVVLILFITAFQVLSIGFIGIQNQILKKELFKLQSSIQTLK